MLAQAMLHAASTEQLNLSLEQSELHRDYSAAATAFRLCTAHIPQHCKHAKGDKAQQSKVHQSNSRHPQGPAKQGAESRLCKQGLQSKAQQKQHGVEAGRGKHNTQGSSTRPANQAKQGSVQPKAIDSLEDQVANQGKAVGAAGTCRERSDFVRAAR